MIDDFYFTYIDTSKFKFPDLDSETERFLWRRKADLEVVLRNMDTESETGLLYFITILAIYPWR